MTQNKYNTIRDGLYNEACGVSKVKGNDYTRGEKDVLANFKNVGKKLGLDAKQVLLVYMDKHQDAIANYIKTNGQSESEPIRMRIIDNINYLFLLYGLIEDEKEQITEENRENFFSQSKREKTSTMDRPKTLNILPDADGKGYTLDINGSKWGGYSDVSEGKPTNTVHVRGEESGKIEYMVGARTNGTEYGDGQNPNSRIQTQPQ